MPGKLEEFAPRVYRFALRLTGDAHLAEDLCQEALVRAWQRRKQLRDSGKLRVWLFRITANLWSDRQRRSAANSRKEEHLREEPEDATECVEARASRREDVQRAIQAMDSLPPRQREVIYLHACESLSILEIAEILGINAGAVKASLSMGRKRLRHMLKDIFQDVAGQRSESRNEPNSMR